MPASHIIIHLALQIPFVLLTYSWRSYYSWITMTSQ